MKVHFPPLPRRPRELYHVRAIGWPLRRRTRPTVVKTVCEGWVHLAAVVLWLEVGLGYSCTVHRLRL